MSYRLCADGLVCGTNTTVSTVADSTGQCTLGPICLVVPLASAKCYNLSAENRPSSADVKFRRDGHGWPNNSKMVQFPHCGLIWRVAMSSEKTSSAKWQKKKFGFPLRLTRFPSVSKLETQKLEPRNQLLSRLFIQS